jgi:hypothetical protein
VHAEAAGLRKASPVRPDTAVAADLAALAVRAGLDRLSGALARAAAAFAGMRAWTVFGFARLDDLARERFGRSGRWLRELAVLGDALAACPALAAALTGSDGGRPLGRVAAILIARAIATETSLSSEEWIAAGRALSVRDLRAAIRRERASAATGTASAPGPADDAAGALDAPDAESCGPGVADDAAGATGVADDDDPDADRILLRLPVPLPILAAFDEALDLHRAIEGRSTSVTSFVEALVGEAQSGRPDPSPGFMAPLVRGVPEARIEAALRRATGGWAALPAPFAALDVGGGEGRTDPAGDEGSIHNDAAAPPRRGDADAGATAVAEASASLGRFAALEVVAGRGDAVELDRQIRSLIHLENEMETRLGHLLAAMAERRDWMRLRFAGLGHYAEERLGMSRSRAGERARLARALRPLPAVAAACASGRISMEAAALIHRMLGDEPVGTDVESAWVEHASAATLKRMRDEARAAGRYRARAWATGPAACAIGSAACAVGSAACAIGPRAPANGTAAVFIGAGSPATGARSLDPVPPRPLADDHWLASLRRAPGTAIGRILEFGFRAAGLSNPCTAAPEVFQALVHEPDVFLRLRLPADLAADLLTAIEAARDAVEERVASVPWDAPWPGAAAEPPSADAHAAVAEPPSAWVARIAFVRGRRAPLWVGLLALLEDFALTWDTDGAAPERRDDSVFVRDGWRCAAPGCSSRRNLEVHHVVYRSHGGSDDGWNLVTLCRFHHQRGEHGGLLSVRGRAPTGLTWRLGRSDVATLYRAEMRFSAIRFP